MSPKALYLFLFIILSLSNTAFGQTLDLMGTVQGTVKIAPSGVAARKASITVVELKKTAVAAEDGAYEIKNIPVGRYQIIAHLDHVGDVVKTVEITSEKALIIDFDLSLAPINEKVTVTATGSAESIENSYQTVLSVSAIEIAEKNPLSIGEALNNQLGIANRSFGPGTGRPVIRGFDGDRVLVLQDGLRVGGIASQSGDEAEPIDVLSLDRLEVVKGPATLLYGSNAIGGVVNGISTNDIYQKGLSGYFTAFGGSNNWQAGGSGGLKFGFRNFLFFSNGGVQKANDYRSPAGTVLNSYARNANVSGGAGWFPQQGWLAFTYSFDQRRHGIPVVPDAIDFEYLKERRHGYAIKGGLRGLGSFIESGDFALSYNDYKAREFEFESDKNVTKLDSVATNKNFNYRANFNHHRRRMFSGTFGFSGFRRDYEAVGAEAPAPRTKQNSFAIYGLERVDFERVGFQFGGRIEQNGYRPAGNLRDRGFTGFSGSAALRLRLWNGGSFVANYQHSFRAPALEELYNNGPHPGIQVFDIGNPNLKAERGDGVDLSLRHTTDRLQFEGSVYYYNLHNFVFPAFTGIIDSASHLPVVNYAQGNGRYVGSEIGVGVKLLESLRLNVKADYVRAELTANNKPLPRIPPFRGTVSLDWRYKALNLRPEITLAAKQNRLFDNETATTGYAVVNLVAGYSFVTRRTVHIFSATLFNLNNRLYRNHLSFIKKIAPEIGRGARFNYTIRF